VHMQICPVCENEQWRNIYQIDQWTIDECIRCKFARIDPLPEHESRSELYTEEKIVKRDTRKRSTLTKFSRFMKRSFNKLTKRDKSKIFYTKLSRYLSHGKKILDVGCGAGAFLISANQRFACSGVEISQYLADKARANGDFQIHVGNFQTLDFQDEKFDGITLISIIEHLDDPLGTIKKCYSLLNPGGVLLLKTVNYSCWNRLLVRDKWTGLRPPDHVIYFSPSNLTTILKKVGFSNTKTSAWTFNDNMYCDAWK